MSRSFDPKPLSFNPERNRRPVVPPSPPESVFVPNQYEPCRKLSLEKLMLRVMLYFILLVSVYWMIAGIINNTHEIPYGLMIITVAVAAGSLACSSCYVSED